jgi:hypothetical protein
MANKTLKTRVVNKHDVEANWKLATNFSPLNGEFIIYDEDENYSYKRIKIGNGKDLVSDLPFIDEYLSNIVETYIMNIDYSLLAFDTSEIVVNTTATTSVLGQAILGQMVLA